MKQVENSEGICFVQSCPHDWVQSLLFDGPPQGFSPIVTTKHNVMKYMENDEYFILFIRHFPCPSPIECIHQHPIKWIHQCICTQRDITGHLSQGEIL